MTRLEPWRPVLGINDSTKQKLTFNRVCSLISLTWAFDSNLQCYETFLNILKQPDNFYFLLFIHGRNFVIDFNELCINTVVSMYVKSLNVGC